MPNAKLQSYLHFHVIVFIWGFTAVLGALISIDALPLVFYRMWLASGFIFLWILYKKKPLKMTAKQLLILASAGIVKLVSFHPRILFLDIYRDEK